MSSNQVRGFERLIWAIDELPLDVFHRAAIGFCLPPLLQRLMGDGASILSVIASTLGALLALKFGFGFVRRLFPASAELKAAWRERRMLGKAYDSYEWQKLLGYGLGMLAFGVWSPDALKSCTAAALTLVVAGAVGTAFWQVRKRALAAQALPKAS